MQAEMINGPQDGLVVTIPPDCRELRFPVVIDPGFISQFRAQNLSLEKMEMPVAIYTRRTSNTFIYAGEH